MNFFEKMRTQKVLSFTLILFTLSVGIVLGTLINSGVKAAKDGDKVAPGATPLVIPNPVELSNTFSQIAKQVEPTVVNISTTYLPKQARARNYGRRQVMPQDEGDQGDPSGMDDFIQRFFTPFGNGNGAPEMQRKGQALGSGVVVDRAGYILTNNHVVDKADRIQVKFTGDSTDYDAKVVGRDAPTDLAVIRIEGKKNLEAAKIGNSDAVQVGDWAIAIGSPFGFQATVTAGIISAKEREVDQSMQFQHFLQTDAAINPGNSGGPLLNIRGEVIGINTAIATQSGGYQGVGFALPINTAAQVYNDIIKNGKVTRGSIGISFVQSNTDQARANLRVAGAKDGGVFVSEVAPEGPSKKAGMKDGDVIVAINGKPIREGSQLIAMVTATPVGSPLNITVEREGKRENLKVVVGDLAQIFPDRFGNRDESSKSAEATTVSFGMQIQNLTEKQQESLGLKQKGGVQVVSVEPSSFADDIRLQTGDVIVSINRVPVNTKEDITRIRDTLKPGDAVQFRVMRKTGRNGTDWSTNFVAGTLPLNGR